MSRSLRPETSCDRPSSHLRNMDVNMAAELSPTNSSSSGELSVSPEPPRETQAFLGKVTVIDYFTFQHKHLKVTNIDDMTETLYVKLPENMTRCDHLPITCEYLLGRGSYGAVYAHADNATVKLYDSVTELYHELMVCDMIQIGKATAEDGQDKALVDYLSACTSCHALFMPQFRCSLQDYGHWHDGSIEPLVRGFQGLKDAVYYLVAVVEGSSPIISQDQPPHAPHGVCEIHQDVAGANVRMEEAAVPIQKVNGIFEALKAPHQGLNTTIRIPWRR